MRQWVVLAGIFMAWVVTFLVGWNVVRYAEEQSFYLTGITAIREAFTAALLAAGERKQTRVDREEVLLFLSGPTKEALEAGRIRIVSESVEVDDQPPPKAKGGFVFEIDGSRFVLEADGNIRTEGP